MFKDTIVCLFDDSGNLFDDWVAVGYEVVCVDVLCPPEGERIGRRRRVHADLTKPLALTDLGLTEDDVAFVSCHPPCDHLAVSGARWFKGKGLRPLARSIEMFATAAEFCESTRAPYMIENPVSTISTYWRKPDHIYNPCEYTGYESADNYTKKTCLWVGNGFVMPPANRDETLGPPDNRIHAAPPGPMRAYFRSVTPKGFGRAVFESNCPLFDGNLV